ncbi:malonyl-[acyl-carrier protein] O-methyltransferase [Vibrio zhanjiangensis]|uniref:Malonyl-[acyl-carrier protein] O-methyltransferase n=1 Tax=Vibrio zhanjiangensis TaxID=1046128 RepID=A0ABQ6F1D9_9VIBR|nr:malonyl-ACP O-methyltransferase BioC [Vibrio zhanjiangensis]GLT19312.1 malonyl-[acyl-carrier protein] O-methyltransferase [Vibrio zhanjiangensis]
MEQMILDYPSLLVDKSAIAVAFGKAADTYDSHAAFQREVGARLLKLLPEDMRGKTVLDLGCGTGYFAALLRDRGARVVCCDLSEKMLDKARQRCGLTNMQYHQGDAESLPFGDRSIDVVFSSLALQWCNDLSGPLREMRRVLKPDGTIYFSTLLDGSLHELKQSWNVADKYQHVNDFHTLDQIKIALAQAGCHCHQLDLPTITVWYDSAFSLMRDLKGIGANYVSGRSNGLTNRSMLLKVEQAYRGFRNHQGLVPATYQVCLGVIHI